MAIVSNIQAKKNSRLFGQLLDKVVDKLGLVRCKTVQFVGGLLGDANHHGHTSVVCGPSAVGTGTASLNLIHVLVNLVGIYIIYRAAVYVVLLHDDVVKLLALHLLIPDAYFGAYDHIVTNVAFHFGILEPLLCGCVVLYYLVVLQCVKNGVLDVFVTLALVKLNLLHSSLLMPFRLVLASGSPGFFTNSEAKVQRIFELCKQKPK